MKFTRLHTASEVKDLLEYHNRNSEFIVLDTETTSVNPRLAKLLDIQISGKSEDEAVIFSADKAALLADISKSLVIVAHSYKYDAHVLFRHGVDLLSHTWRDTLLIGHLLDENRESYSLDSYVKEYWNDDYKEKFWETYKTYEEAPAEIATEYACKDIVYTGRLFRCFTPNSRDGNGLPDSLVTHVHRLQDSLLRTEIAGIEVDKEYLTNLGVDIKRRIDELAPKMRGCVKDEIEIIELQSWQKEIDKRQTEKGKARVPRPVFSFDSPKQLSTLLYGILELPEQRNEKTQAISTDYSSLERIKQDHAVVELIQENRELQKIYGTYIEGTLDRIENGTSTIYPEFRVAGTVTGRISHSNPNLGQLPKSGGVRGIYRPRAGSIFISADYSQLEVCLEANFTKDRALSEIFTKGLSKHDITARELGISRDAAKTLNFAMQYWCSHFKVAKLLGVSVDEAKDIWNSYWELYSGPRNLKAETDRMVNDGEPITTVFGRKRRFEKKKRAPWDSDYRQAYNFLIQSTGADITSKAFYLVSEWLQAGRCGRGLFTVHDELVIEADSDFSDAVESQILGTMVAVGNEIGLEIPLKAESSGPMSRWED